jgi:hypothetical protein
MGCLTRILCCACAPLLAAGNVALAGEQTSSGFRVPIASVNAGGAMTMGRATGADMFSRAGATIGQAAPPGVGRDADGQLVCVAGLWTPQAEAPTVPVCTGDCNADGAVTVDELVRGVNVALGSAELAACDALDANGDAAVTINEVVKAVNNALNGCPVT